jgi:hypothetical protein
LTGIPGTVGGALFGNACRVIGGHIQGAEVVPLILKLWPKRDTKPHAPKDGRYVTDGDGQRV